MKEPVRYIEVALGATNNRAIIIKTTQLDEYVRRAQSNKLALYRSYYEFDEELLEHFKIRKSISGYRGVQYVNTIILDLDKGTDTAEALLERVKAFVKHLLDDYQISREYIQPWFSGNGYHIELAELFNFNPGKQLARTVRETLKTLFPEADDIYDIPRLIRVGNTLNQKTGRYKIPLTLEELQTLTAQEITVLAESVRPEFKSELREAVTKILSKFVVEPLPDVPYNTMVSKDKPGQVVTCMQKVFNAGETPGTRHEKILRMTSAFRRAGIPFEGVVTLMQKWAAGLEPYEVRRIVEDLFKKGYQYACHDTVMAANCDPSCVFFKHKNYSMEVVNAVEMERDFVKFVSTDFTQTSFDLAEFYQIFAKIDGVDTQISHRFYPGEFVLVIGDTGLGKTAWMQNLCIGLTRMKILYLSLEVHQNLVYRRFVQIAHGMTKEQVYQHYEGAEEHLSSEFSHIQVMTSSPTIGAISRLVADVGPQMIVVDTTDGIEAENQRDDLGRENAIVRGLREIAQRQNVIVVGVHHISKAGAFGGQLNVHSGKGSSGFEQKADKVIAIEGTQQGKVRTIRTLKARDEAPFSLSLHYDTSTFRFTQPKKAQVKHVG